MLPKKQLSIVVPIYNEEESIREVCHRLFELQSLTSPELLIDFIFVDDGSSDKSLLYLKDAASKFQNVRVISFSRNFGHQIAITAGIDHAVGDYVAIIDGDLQDPPELILEMYKLAQEGYEVVYGKRRSRAGETVFKKFTAAAFYRVLGYLCEVKIPKDTGDFRLMSRKAIEGFNRMRERHRFVRGMVPWLGFKAVALEYDREERFAGTTKYPLKKMLHFAANAVLSFSTKPLSIAIRLGLITIMMGIMGGFYMIYLKLFTNLPIPGLTAILLAISFFSGIQLFLIGIVGEYVARIFEESKGRPLYLINEKINI